MQPTKALVNIPTVSDWLACSPEVHGQAQPVDLPQVCGYYSFVVKVEDLPVQHLGAVRPGASCVGEHSEMVVVTGDPADASICFIDFVC